MDQPANALTSSIADRVRRCGAKAFSIDASNLTLASTPDNTTGWDSLGHLVFMMELELEFGIALSTEEIPTMLSIDIVCDTISERM